MSTGADAPGATASAVEPVAVAEDLTAAWVSAALGAEVTRVSRTRVGTGQMGECYRLDLQGEPTLPRTLLAKLPAADPATREFLHGSYGIEVTFYRELQPTLDIRTPRAHYAQLSDAPEHRGTFTLLLDDLAPATQGDQIAGCTPAQALSAAENVAGLHAPRWADPGLTDIEGLALPGPDDADMMDALFGDTVAKVLGQLADRVPIEDARTLEAVTPYAGRWSVAHGDRFGLVHGDYRLDNLLFHPDGRVWAVDWQTLALGLPARDVAFLISSGLSIADRRAHERDLVEAYRCRLSSLGVTAYSAEECWEDYRLALLQTLLIAVFGCGYSSSRTERGDAMFATMIARGCQAIRDLDTLDLLRSL